MGVFPANQNSFKSEVGRELNSKQPTFSGPDGFGGRGALEEISEFTKKIDKIKFFAYLIRYFVTTLLPKTENN